jgi:hypothetical protein
MSVATHERVVLSKYDTLPTSGTGIEQISLGLPFTLLTTTYPFLTNDLGSNLQVQLACTLGGGKLFFTNLNILSNLVRLNASYEREVRGYYSTVTVGTDGLLYVNTDTTGINPNWDAAWRPITGGFWASRWSLLPDMVCDSPITPWGSGTIHQGKTGTRGAYIDGFLYFADSSPMGLRRVDPSTLSILAANSVSNARGNPVGKNGRVYTIDDEWVGGSITPFKVHAFDAQNCAELTTATYNEENGGQFSCGLALGATYLIAWVQSSLAAHHWRIFKLDYITLEVLQSAVIIVPETQSSEILNLTFFDDQNWIAYYYRGVGIINATTLTWKQNVDLVAQGFDTNFNPDSAFRYDIVNEPTIISQSSVDPVWPMPA